MKSSHTVRGTDYRSLRHRPGHEPTHAESKTPERAVEDSHRGATSAQLPPEAYGHAGDFKRTAPHDAEGRIGAATPAIPAREHQAAAPHEAADRPGPTK